MILNGVTVSYGAVVAAGAIVAKDISPSVNSGRTTDKGYTRES